MVSKTARARAWLFPTSPRSPYKLQGELQLLKNFDGRIWNNQTQLEFAKHLSNYAGFEGDVSKVETAFSARDRLRGPRLLGFICTPKRGSKNGKLEFTEIGNIFLNATIEQQELIFQRQISKVQYYSNLHNSKGFEDMNIRPMTLVIKLLLELDKLSKEEIALFALTTIDHKKINSTIDEIRNYRKSVSLQKPGIERKTFRKQFAYEYVQNIYIDDISDGRTKLREGGNDFVKTKLQTLKDYADSTIRYLRSTGLFTVLPHGQSLTLTKAKLDDAIFLLNSLGTGISPNSDNDYYVYIKDYLGNPSLPELRIDDKESQIADFNKKLVEVKNNNSEIANNLLAEFTNAKSNAEKINVIVKLDKKLTDIQLKNVAKNIRSDFSSSFEDIKSMFSNINSKDKEVVDRPLMYEWNTWRSMVLINDALNVQGNYHADADGNPVSTASGNMPDILCEYDKFWLGVEVTLQSGFKQYESEGESIIRHIGNLQKNKISENDLRPVFGLFIAEKINAEVIAHLFAIANRVMQVYLGKVRILPIDRETFVKLTESVLLHPNFSNQVFLKFFEDAFSNQYSNLGELDWYELVKNKATQLHRLYH